MQYYACKLNAATQLMQLSDQTRLTTTIQFQLTEDSPLPNSFPTKYTVHYVSVEGQMDQPTAEQLQASIMQLHM